MKLGGVFLAFMVLNFLLFGFGIIGNTNPILNYFLYGGQGFWESIFDFTGLIASASTILGGLALAFGIALKNEYMIFGGFFGFVVAYGATILPIKDYFPSPFGYVIVALLTFILAWSGLEWWRGKD